MRHLGNYSFDATGIASRGARQWLGEWRKLTRIAVIPRNLNAGWLYYAVFEFSGDEQLAVQIPSDWRGRPRVTALVGLLQEAQRNAPATVEILPRARLVLEWGDRSDYACAHYRATGVNNFDTNKLLDAARWRWVWLQHGQAARLARAAMQYAPSELAPIKTLLLIEAERGARATRVLALCETVLARAPGDREAQQIKGEALAWLNRPLWKKALGWLPLAIPLAVAAAGLVIFGWGHWQDARRDERKREAEQRLEMVRKATAAGLEARAREGDAAAMMMLALARERGEHGLKIDRAAAHAWRLRAAEAGDVTAMLRVGIDLSRGKDVPKDIATAQRWLTQAAERGSGSAADTLGDLFHAGREVPQDYAASFKWYARAWELAYRPARRQLAYHYEKGLGTEKDLGEAFALYRVLAGEGDGWAASRLGAMFASGQGVEIDEVEAARWYRVGAEKGDASAQMNLAMVLRNGRGVKRDVAEAMTWLAKAEAQRSPEAGALQADLLWHGEGVPQDRAEALRRLQAQMEKGSTVARTLLGKYLLVSGPQQDLARARRLFREGAEAGSSADLGYYGLLCLEGVGGPRDIGAALASLAAASQAGQPIAALFLAGARLGYGQPDAVPDLAAAREAMEKIRAHGRPFAPYFKRLDEGGDLPALLAGEVAPAEADAKKDARDPAEALPQERRPQPLIQTPPAYPLAMRTLELEGQVLVEFIVASTGRVEEVHAVLSTLPSFDRAAISAVRQWRFKPAVKAGRAVPTRMQVPIVFSLQREPQTEGVRVEAERR